MWKEGLSYDLPVEKPVARYLDSCLMLEVPGHCGLCKPWVGGPECFEKAGVESYREQTSKQPFGMTLQNLLPPGSYLEFLP